MFQKWFKYELLIFAKKSQENLPKKDRTFNSWIFYFVDQMLAVILWKKDNVIFKN
jgi:hypothetical protein